jgi:hypothetical protein
LVILRLAVIKNAIYENPNHHFAATAYRLLYTTATSDDWCNELQAIQANTSQQSNVEQITQPNFKTSVLILIASISFAFFMVEVLRWPSPGTLLYRKPFNCIPCLSAWTALALFFLPEACTQVMSTMFGAGALGAFVKPAAQKLYNTLIKI